MSYLHDVYYHNSTVITFVKANIDITGGCSQLHVAYSMLAMMNCAQCVFPFKLQSLWRINAMK